MPSGTKKRQQQRKKARRARHEPQQNEERMPPTEAEGMASAPLTGIHSLPYETLSAIFSFLPIPDLARCAAVCEQWHDIVTGSSRLWEGKRYRSYRRPRESAAVYAVLRALPSIQEVVVETGKFRIDISYPRLILRVSDISDTGSAEDGPRLELCPNLKERGIFAQFLSEDRLDTSKGIGRLRVLNITCPRLKELTFLRRYSDVLEELELKCVNLPSAAYAGLRQLWNLQRLCLYDSRVAVRDREVALKGMRCLASLHLDRCNLFSDLSCLRHCQRLRELRVDASLWNTSLTGLHDLPTGLRSLHLARYAVAADELSKVAARLPLLEKLHLGTCELAHLDFLRRCPRLHRLCLQFAYWPDTSQLSNLRHLTCLEVLDLTKCRVDADVLSGALPSLTRLHTLSLSYAVDVAHLRFLRHCPQLHTLSLYDTIGFEEQAYQELCHLNNLQTLNISFDVRNFVHEVVRPRLPKLNILCSEQFNLQSNRWT